MSDLNIKKGFLVDFTATVKSRSGSSVNLSNFDGVEFIMVNNKNNSVKINSAAIFVNKSLGQVSYAFTDEDVNIVGEYRGYFAFKNELGEKKMSAPSTEFSIKINESYV